MVHAARVGTPAGAAAAPNWPASAPKEHDSNRIPVLATPAAAPQKRWLSLDDGSRIDIDRDCVIGRDPNGSDAAQRGLRPVRIDDHSGEMSRAHAEVRIVGGEVVIVDRNSTNGVFVRDATGCAGSG